MYLMNPQAGSGGRNSLVEPSGGQMKKIVLIILLFIIFDICVIGLIYHFNPNYLTSHELILNPDAKHYHILSVNLLNGNGFSRHRTAPFQPDIIRTPLYPCVMAFILYLFGQNAFWSVYFFQMILFQITIVVTYHTGKTLLNSKTGMIAAIFMMFDSVSFYYSFEPMTETLYTLLLVSSFLYFLKYLKENRIFFLFLSVLFLICSTFTRPSSLYVILIYAIVIFVRELKQKTRLIPILFCFILYPAFLSPWIIRNYMIFNIPTLSYIDTMNLIYFTGAGAIGMKRNMTLEESQAEVSKIYNIPTYRQFMNDQLDGKTFKDFDKKLKKIQFEILLVDIPSLIISSIKGIIAASISHTTSDYAYIYGQDFQSPGIENLVQGRIKKFAEKLIENHIIFIFFFIYQNIFNLTYIFMAIYSLSYIILNFKILYNNPLLLSLILLLGYMYALTASIGYLSYARFRIPNMPFVYLLIGFTLSQLIIKWGKLRNE